MKNVILCLFFCLTSFAVTGQEFTPDDNASHITFRIKNFGSTVKGTIKGLEGRIRFDPAHPYDAVIDVSLDASTIDTGIGLRDNHLKKAEYLDVKNFPRLRMVSSAITSPKPGEFIFTGKLTIRDVTKEITYPFTFTSGLFHGEFQINRRDFGVGGNSISMADNLTVDIEVAVKK